MSWFSFQPQNDIERGRQAMVYYHNQMTTFPNYAMSLEECINIASKGHPDAFLDGLGFAISAIDMRDSQVEDAMVSLANRSSGLPSNNSNDYTSALSNRASNLTTVDYFYATPEVAKESAVDIAKGAQAVGNAVIDTGKSLLVVGPLLIVAAVIFIGYSRTRTLAGR